MLSLGKLAQLASNSPSERQDELMSIESELHLVEHQEDLPEIVLSSLGYDFKKQKVLGPAEIITVSTKILICLQLLFMHMILQTLKVQFYD